MKQLIFNRRKYGRELLIDAVSEEEMEFIDDILQPSFYILLFVKKGNGRYQLDLEDFMLKNNMAIFIRPGSINIVKDITIEQGRMLVFEGAFLDEFFVDKNFIYKFNCFHSQDFPSFLPIDMRQFLKYYNMAAEIQEEILAMTGDSHHILRSLIYYLLIRMDQHYAERYGAPRSNLADTKMLEFQKLLFSTIRENKNVEGYARQLGISRVHLNKLCRQYYSKTASQVIKEHLITEIKKELKYSKKDFSEIAYAFNFSAPSNFSRFVKQMTGLTPQEFIRPLSN
ncbi:MAG: AraC family transcriptional regulator [Phaeodactylibacter sp.]|nr:AraC family transcriptional regulator [Phaeodactylibacter sp.]MCB9286939.1 AraC family transcriptional regulator [Lewinellaceae bacterium]